MRFIVLRVPVPKVTAVEERYSVFSNIPNICCNLA